MSTDISVTSQTDVQDYIPEFLDSKNKQALAVLIISTNEMLVDLFSEKRFRIVPGLPPVKLWPHLLGLFKHTTNYSGALQRLESIKKHASQDPTASLSIPVSSLQINQTTDIETWTISCVKWILDANRAFEKIQKIIN